MVDQKNLFLALGLSLAILLGFQYFVEEPRRQRQLAHQQALEQARSTDSALPAPGPVSGSVSAPAAGTGQAGGAPVPGIARDRADVLAAGPRLPIRTPSLTGSLNLANGRIDDLVLARFRETLDSDSDRITLLSPAGTANPYFAEFGWLTPTGDAVGAAGTAWTTRSTALTETEPVVLEAVSPDGLRLTRTVAVDADYMFTITQTVTNDGTAPLDLFPFGRLARVNTPDTLGFYILHEGPIGVFNGTLDELDYDDLRDAGTVNEDSGAGWIGITDKYWLAALIPDRQVENRMRFHYRWQGGDTYQADYQSPGTTLAPGASVTVTNHFFAGAKQLRILKHYAATVGVERFEMAIDFGWFFFLTKPFLQILIVFADWFGNFGLAILVLTVLVKLVFFPLANKSYVSMSRMKNLQPKMIELRDRYGDNRPKLQQEMMALYKREKVNPVSGCLPIIVQIPVFFALYKVLFVSIEMRQAPFYGWIRDLSVADPTSLLELFGLVPWGAPDFVSIGIWPLLMGATMFLQQKLNPQPPDPVQARVFMLMPFIFTILLARFPAGLVIYWTWNNLLSIVQQYVIMRRMGVPIGGKSA